MFIILVKKVTKNLVVSVGCLIFALLKRCCFNLNVGCYEKHSFDT